LSVPAITIAAIFAAANAGPASDLSDLPEPAEIGDASAQAASAPLPPEEVQAASEPLAPEQGAPAATAGEAPPADVANEPGEGVQINSKMAPDEPVAVAGAKDSDRKEIVVQAETGPPPGDPLQNVNIQTFEVVQAVDKALVAPVTHGYMKVVPKPMRDGIHNVVTNLDEPIVFLSFLLQLKPIQALKTVGRFGINSTIGLAGLFDVAKKKPFNRPHVPNGFGYTLAYYGVKPGPFLYLPLIGSTTVRDLFGKLAELPVLPFAIGKPLNDPAYVIPKATISAIDDRAQDDERLRKIHDESSNPYAVYRSYYLRKRQAEVDVLKGLRDNADVPVFEDEVPDIGDEVAPVDKGNSLDPGDLPATGQVQPSVDKAAVPAE